MKNFKVLVVCLMMFLSCFMFPCNTSAAQAIEESMVLATTTSTQDSGLLDVLIPVFEKEYNTKVKVVAVGSGQAMEMGQRGDADVLLVHSRKAEDEFIAQGFGVNRKDVMHNEFLLIGPSSDPAGIKGMTDASAAFKKIASSNNKFVSRGDKSGTHSKELSVWTKLNLKPAGDWYIESGQGMGDTLMMANEMNAYTLTDEATYLSWQKKIVLQQMVQGDAILFNPYGVIEVNPAKYPTIHNKAAKAFSDFITGQKGQAMIAVFGADKYGKALFTPDAIAATAVASPKTAASVQTTGTYKVVVSAARVRTGPSTNYATLGLLFSGTSVEVVGTSGEWLKIRYNNQTAYVAGWLLKKQ